MESRKETTDASLVRELERIYFLTRTSALNNCSFFGNTPEAVHANACQLVSEVQTLAERCDKMISRGECIRWVVYAGVKVPAWLLAESILVYVSQFPSTHFPLNDQTLPVLKGLDSRVSTKSAMQIIAKSVCKEPVANWTCPATNPMFVTGLMRESWVNRPGDSRLLCINRFLDDNVNPFVSW